MVDGRKTKKNSLLEILLEERMNKALDSHLLTDICYQNTCKSLDEKLKKLEKIKLTKKQFLAVDRVLTAQNFNSSEYGRAAYRQGFKDCLILLQEIEQLKETI